jgi:hypothetical protein
MQQLPKQKEPPTHIADAHAGWLAGICIILCALAFVITAMTGPPSSSDFASMTVFP